MILFKHFLLFLALALPAFLFAQKDDEKIAKHYAKDEYEKVLKVARKADHLSDTSWSRAGLSANQLGQDSLALIYFNRVLQQNPRYANAYYFKSYIEINYGKTRQALSDIRQAIAIKDDDPDFWIQLGKVQRQRDEPDSALAAYQQASLLPDCPATIYFFIGNALVALDRDSAALLAYDSSRQVLDHGSDEYRFTLFNIGVLEYDKGSHTAARTVLEEMLSLDPKDYRGVKKLIQVYYALGEYALAAPLKKTMYEAYEKGELEEGTEDFCFDQFKWKGRDVIAYERFDNIGKLYYKHVFYLFDDKGKTEMTVQTESSFATRMAGAQYVMGMDKGKKHYTYFDYTFKEDFQYPDLKAAVIAILDGKAKPTSSSGKD